MTGAEKLTAQFYGWERRGRGWLVYGKPVDIEPPFEYFSRGSTLAQTASDDGYVPNIFERLDKWLSGPDKKAKLEMKPDRLVPMAPTAEGALRVLGLTMPRGEKVHAEAGECLLLMLSPAKCPVSFEILAAPDEITIQLACREPDLFLVRSQVKAYFPSCTISEGKGYRIIEQQQPVAILDLGLKEEFMRPLEMADGFDTDPLTGLFAIMDGLEGDERAAAVQILFKGAVDPWPGSILSSVTDYDGSSFFMDAPEMPKLAREKVSSQLYGASIRCIGQAGTKGEAASIAQHLANALVRVSASPHNSLMPLGNGGYPLEDHIEDVIERQSRRLGMLLNSAELVNLVHMPSASVVSSKLKRDSRKTVAAPASAQGKGLILGTNVHQGNERQVSVSAGQRLRHMHLIGATGTGKTTLMQNCIMQDIREGRGCAVIDPHGDLIESILEKLPSHRVDDTILVDPSDAMFPIGFNMLCANTEYEKEVLSSDLVAVFRRLSTSWGDQMNSVFANAILAFLENTKRGTLMDLRRFLVEKDFRDSYLKTVTDPGVAYYWQKEYPIVKGASIGPILTRLDTFLRPKVIRNMVAQEACMDFGDILNSQKVLLVKLPQGLIGEENSYLLGTAFLSKIYQAAMARQAMEKPERKDFFVYVDEFQNFVTPSLSQILAGARKYHLGLILAHQEMQQLMKDDAGLASSVMGNAGTRICFRLGDSDAKRFEDGFAHFSAGDLVNLGTGEAVARVERADHDFNLNVPLHAQGGGQGGNRDEVAARSRKLYGRPKEEVEAMFPYAQAEETAEVLPKPVMKEQGKVAVVDAKVETQEATRQTETTGGLSQEQVEETKAALVRQKEISQHRYLQVLIKKMAEARGYRAVIEQPTSDGKGRVDVGLERDGRRVACEIGMTTTKDWELHNIRKCLAAGYDKVIAVARDGKAVNAMQAKVDALLNSKEAASVLVTDLEGLYGFMDRQAAKALTSKVEKRVKGYRIKVEYGQADDESTKHKQRDIADALIKSYKKGD